MCRSSFDSTVRTLALLVIAAWFTAAACGGDDPPPNGDVDANRDTDASNPGGDGGTETWPTFESDVIPLLETRCGAGDNACHSRVAYGAISDSDCRGWLSLENQPLGSVFYAGPDEGNPTGCPDMELYDRLVQLDAWQCEQFDPRMRYVDPCNPEASYLLRKIAGGPYCRDGNGDITQPMPVGSVLDAQSIAIIEQWIAVGAPRDGEPLPDCTPTVNVPEAVISHPSDGEMRQLDSSIPFIGNAIDVEDGDIPDARMVWTSDRQGEIGTGREFQAALNSLGEHVITLTATDADGNQGTATITLEIVP